MFHSSKIIISCFFLIFSISTVSAESAPNFSLNGDKGTVALSQYKNQVVYLDFWASWCKPCRKSFDFMNNMQERYAKNGLKIIAINLDEDHSAATRFLKDHPASFTIAYDAEGKTPGAYGLTVMPTSYLIDKKGNIIFKHKGFKEDQTTQLEQAITQALNRK